MLPSRTGTSQIKTCNWPSHPVFPPSIYESLLNFELTFFLPFSTACTRVSSISSVSNLLSKISQHLQTELISFPCVPCVLCICFFHIFISFQCDFRQGFEVNALLN